MHALACESCGCTFQSRRPKQKFCGRQCREKDRATRAAIVCKHCGKHVPTTKHRAASGQKYCNRHCMAADLWTAVRTCVECGKQFRRSPQIRDKAKYCGKKCFFKARSAGRQQWDRSKVDEATRIAAWHRGGRYRHAPSAKALREINANISRHLWAVARLDRSLAVPKDCRRCGRLCVGRPGEFCSGKCAEEVLLAGMCVGCGEAVQHNGRVRKPVCKKCRRKMEAEKKNQLASNNRKRCRKYGVPYDPKLKSRWIFERDGYKCHICGVQTKPELGYGHPRYPTVDHVVPLSAGIYGHVESNVRCACSDCNTRKGVEWDRQLRLFAQPCAT